MLKTERLTIRRVRAEDWKAIQAIWADAANSEYAKFDKPNKLDDPSVCHRIAKWASFADSREHIFFAVCFKDIVIGYVAFNKRDDGYEIGYCFHSDYHGKGYAKESISALLGVIKSGGKTRITAGTALKNTPSVNLLTSLGFNRTYIEKVSFYKDSEGNDIVFDGGVFELII